MTIRGVLIFAAVTTATASAAATLASYQWKARPLLIFSQDEADARLKKQLGIVRGNKRAIGERDMAVVVVLPRSVNVIAGPGASLSPQALRQQYRISQNQFRAILIGKDGGQKLSSAEPVSAARLFSTIDAMPMRRDEIHKSGHAQR